MKRFIIMIAVAALGVAMASCAKEERFAEESTVTHIQVLKARIAADDITKTYFDGATFKWKKNDNCVVRSDNANGFSTFTFTGDDTDGEATFTNASDDHLVYGQNSFAIYPANTSTEGDKHYPLEEGGSLKIPLKNSYTWSDGNVEAPMLARVESGTPLEFKHLGGCLKVTYKNVPPKAASLVVSAPIDESSSYKICNIMGSTENWTTAGGGFDPSETPYLKAYSHSGTYKISFNILSATAAQRVDGITVYVPLPVGPVESAGKNVYPKLRISLAFADGSDVPGSVRTATNVQIERAKIKPMPVIKLPGYTVETVLSGLAKTPHDIIRISDTEYITTAETYHIYFVDASGKTATQSKASSARYPQYPYGVCYDGRNVWIANKVGTGTEGVWKYDTSTETFTPYDKGFTHAMQIKKHGSNYYVLARGDGSSAGKIYEFTGGEPGTVAPVVYADFSGIASAGYAWPVSFAFDTDGSMVVAVSASTGTPKECFKLYKVASKGETPAALFGSGEKPADYAAMKDGKSSAASFAPDMQDMEFDASGNLYIADQYCIRKLVRGASGLSDGTIVTVTESGVLPRVDGLAFDSTSSHLYVTNKTAKCIYKVTIE